MGLGGVLLHPLIWGMRDGNALEGAGRFAGSADVEGRRYSLASIVALSFAAMLSGANDLCAIYRWGRRLTPNGLAMLGIERGRAPCHATYHYVFRSLSAADLERALGALVAEDGPLGHVAIDGKRLR